jgi:undecaprenyl-diphosphatase
LEQLLNWDHQILYFINKQLSAPWNDWTMSFWSAEWPWFSLLIIFFAEMILRKQWSQIGILLWIGATVGLADILSHFVFKPWIGRVRPCRTLDFVHIVENCSGWFSFPSNHATNAAVFAVLWLCLRGPRQGAIAVGCGVMVGLSRVYLGVHYPSDILGGFLFGSLFGLLSFQILKRSRLWARHNSTSSPPS